MAAGGRRDRLRRVHQRERVVEPPLPDAVVELTLGDEGAHLLDVVHEPVHVDVGEPRGPRREVSERGAEARRAREARPLRTLEQGRGRVEVVLAHPDQDAAVVEGELQESPGTPLVPPTELVASRAGARVLVDVVAHEAHRGAGQGTQHAREPLLELLAPRRVRAAQEEHRRSGERLEPGHHGGGVRLGVHDLAPYQLAPRDDPADARHDVPHGAQLRDDLRRCTGRLEDVQHELVEARREHGVEDLEHLCFERSGVGTGPPAPEQGGLGRHGLEEPEPGARGGGGHGVVGNGRGRSAEKGEGEAGGEQGVRVQGRRPSALGRRFGRAMATRGARLVRTRDPPPISSDGRSRPEAATRPRRRPHRWASVRT